MDALELRDVDEAAGVAADDHPGRVQPRHRPVAALGDRLRAPRHALAVGEDLAHERVELELLQHVVDREARVGVVEPGHEADRDAGRVALAVHRVDPRAAELLVLRLRPQRPAERVDHAVERLVDLPDLLDAERPDLRVGAGEAERLDRGAGQVAPAALGQHGRLRDDVRAGLEVRLLAALLVAALVAGAHADHRVALDEQLRADGLGEHVGARLLRPVGEPAVELRDRDDVVAVVAERRRRRLERDRALAVEHEVDGLLAHLAEVGPGVVVGQQRADRARVHHAAGELVRPGDAALLDHRHGHLAQRLHQLGVVLEQLQEPDRAGHAGLPAADDRDADLDPLVLRIGRGADELRHRVDRRRELARGDGMVPVGGAISRPCGPSRPR